MYVFTMGLMPEVNYLVTCVLCLVYCIWYCDEVGILQLSFLLSLMIIRFLFVYIFIFLYIVCLVLYMVFLEDVFS